MALRWVAAGALFIVAAEAYRGFRHKRLSIAKEQRTMESFIRALKLPKVSEGDGRQARGVSPSE